MKLIVLNLDEKRIKNVITFDTYRKASVGKLDTLTFSTFDNHLEKNYRVLYKNRSGEFREFIVSEIKEIHDSSGIVYEVYCENSLVELRDYFVEDKRVVKKQAKEALNKILENTNWTSKSLITNKGSKVFYRKSVYAALNDILEEYRCEIETKIKVEGNRVEERKIILKEKIGNDLGKRFSYTKDLVKIEREIKDDVITALYVYGKSKEFKNEEGESTGGYGRRIDFSSINDGKSYVEDNEARKKYGFKKRHKFSKIELDDIEDKTKLLNEAKRLLKIYSKPKVIYQVSVIDLRSYGFEFEGVLEGDSVVIRDKELNISIKARVMEIEESLDNQEETKLTIGNFKEVYGENTKRIEKILYKLNSKQAIYDEVNQDVKDGNIEAKLTKVLKQINEEFKSGTSHMFFDINRGLVLTDKKKESESRFIIELGSRGIRFANSKLSDGSWNWKSAMTAEGIAGESIVTNSISANKLMSDVGESLDLSSNEFIRQTVEKITIVDEKVEDKASKSELDTTKRGLEGKITENKTSIIQNADSINITISQMLHDQNDLDIKINKTINDLASIDKDKIILNDQAINELKDSFGIYGDEIESYKTGVNNKIQELLDTIDEKTSNNKERMDQAFAFTTRELEISSRDSSISLVITNESLDFYDGSRKVAYMTGQRLYITSGVFVDNIIIGNHRWEKQGNILTNVQYIGEG